ncbi:hypothetical protein EVAR_79702_1 [Eumeta japonica]|uniref:Uncharacterized protein n=1 Tax=Eumeta variegata TaxID=151549 RepID=A0A4C1TA54_EUMVA|nr:hypothetical protein EVAR_79702_1 [Eumeta japonica]
MPMVPESPNNLIRWLAAARKYTHVKLRPIKKKQKRITFLLGHKKKRAEIELSGSPLCGRRAASARAPAAPAPRAPRRPTRPYDALRVENRGLMRGT